MQGRPSSFSPSMNRSATTGTRTRPPTALTRPLGPIPTSPYSTSARPTGATLCALRPSTPSSLRRSLTRSRRWSMTTTRSSRSARRTGGSPSSTTPSRSGTGRECRPWEAGCPSAGPSTGFGRPWPLCWTGTASGGRRPTATGRSASAASTALAASPAACQVATGSTSGASASPSRSRRSRPTARCTTCCCEGCRRWRTRRLMGTIRRQCSTSSRPR